MDEGETGLAQVRETIDGLTNKLNVFKERVGLVWGHSMQGYATIEMAGTMLDELPNAKFIAVMPVIYGSNKDKGKPFSERHVWLHADLKGAIVQMLPVVGLVPTEAIRRTVMEVANFTGIPAVVLGSWVRQKATAAIHFAECARFPKYLRRVNAMLSKMPDLNERKELDPGIARAVDDQRVSIVYGERDKILNPLQIKRFARSKKIPLYPLPDGHFPKEENYRLAVNPEGNIMIPNELGLIKAGSY